MVVACRGFAVPSVKKLAAFASLAAVTAASVEDVTAAVQIWSAVSSDATSCVGKLATTTSISLDKKAGSHTICENKSCWAAGSGTRAMYQPAALTSREATRRRAPRDVNVPRGHTSTNQLSVSISSSISVSAWVRTCAAVPPLAHVKGGMLKIKLTRLHGLAGSRNGTPAGGGHGATPRQLRDGVSRRAGGGLCTVLLSIPACRVVLPSIQ